MHKEEAPQGRTMPSSLIKFLWEARLWIQVPCNAGTKNKWLTREQWPLKRAPELFGLRARLGVAMADLVVSLHSHMLCIHLRQWQLQYWRRPLQNTPGLLSNPSHSPLCFIGRPLSQKSILQPPFGRCSRRSSIHEVLELVRPPDTSRTLKQT